MARVRCALLLLVLCSGCANSEAYRLAIGEVAFESPEAASAALRSHVLRNEACQRIRERLILGAIVWDQPENALVVGFDSLPETVVGGVLGQIGSHSDRWRAEVRLNTELVPGSSVVRLKAEVGVSGSYEHLICNLAAGQLAHAALEGLVVESQAAGGQSERVSKTWTWRPPQAGQAEGRTPVEPADH